LIVATWRAIPRRLDGHENAPCQILQPAVGGRWLVVRRTQMLVQAHAMSSWTFHRQEGYRPDGTVHLYDTYPIGRVIPERRRYCQYCYETHNDWSQMSAVDYPQGDVILCGNCGHTSLKALAAVGDPPH
jgi:hypothetical protein